MELPEAAATRLLERYDEDWRQLWWLRVGGEASVVRARDGDAFDSVEAALRVDPLTLRSWCAGREAVA